MVPGFPDLASLPSLLDLPQLADLPRLAEMPDISMAMAAAERGAVIARSAMDAVRASGAIGYAFSDEQRSREDETRQRADEERQRAEEAKQREPSAAADRRESSARPEIRAPRLGARRGVIYARDRREGATRVDAALYWRAYASTS